MRDDFLASIMVAFELSVAVTAKCEKVSSKWRFPRTLFTPLKKKLCLLQANRTVIMWTA